MGRLSPQTQAVLAAFLAAPDASHYGLELARDAELASGTIYPILARLEQRRWVVSSWEDVDQHRVGRPRRRYYRLTPEGTERARAELSRTAALLRRAGVPIAARPRLGRA